MATEFNAGYEIIKTERVGNKEFVLGHNPNAPEPYVTWKRDVETKECYWGRYFTNEQRALNNFKKRVQEEKDYER